MANGISRETYDTMDTDAKLGVLFDYAKENHQEIVTLKKQGFYHKTCATIGGIIGGVVAFFGFKFWG